MAQHMAPTFGILLECENFLFAHEISWCILILFAQRQLSNVIGCNIFFTNVNNYI